MGAKDLVVSDVVKATRRGTPARRRCREEPPNEARCEGDGRQVGEGVTRVQSCPRGETWINCSGDGAIDPATWAAPETDVPETFWGTCPREGFQLQNGGSS